MVCKDKKYHHKNYCVGSCRTQASPQPLQDMKLDCPKLLLDSSGIACKNKYLLNIRPLQMTVSQFRNQYHSRIHSSICTFFSGVNGKKRIAFPVNKEYWRTTVTQHFNIVPQKRAPWISVIERTENSWCSCHCNGTVYRSRKGKAVIISYCIRCYHTTPRNARKSYFTAINLFKGWQKRVRYNSSCYSVVKELFVCWLCMIFIASVAWTIVAVAGIPT